MSTVLVTGFGPFGHTPVNPAEQVARALDSREIGGASIVARILPCAFFDSIEAARQAIREVEPNAVVMMGEYGGRAVVTVERIAQNLIDSTRYQLADNEGRSFQDRATASDGPIAYHSTLPIRAMVKAMRDAGVPADISDTPGTFICNHLMYGVLHHLATSAPQIRAGWIHLPHLPSTAALEQNLGAPSMSMQTSLVGVEAGIRALLAHPVDVDDPIQSRWQI